MTTLEKVNRIKQDFDKMLESIFFTANGNITPPYFFIISNNSNEHLTKVKINDVEEAKEIVINLVGEKHLDSICDNSLPNESQKYLHIQLELNK